MRRIVVAGALCAAKLHAIDIDEDDLDDDFVEESVQDEASSLVEAANFAGLAASVGKAIELAAATWAMAIKGESVALCTLWDRCGVPADGLKQP